jgi:hypothetical protein
MSPEIDEINMLPGRWWMKLKAEGGQEILECKHEISVQRLHLLLLIRWQWEMATEWPLRFFESQKRDCSEVGKYLILLSVAGCECQVKSTAILYTGNWNGKGSRGREKTVPTPGITSVYSITRQGGTCTEKAVVVLMVKSMTVTDIFSEKARSRVNYRRILVQGRVK